MHKTCSSDSEARNRANCYLSLPELEVSEGLVKSINDAWLTRAKLPQHWQTT